MLPMRLGAENPVGLQKHKGFLAGLKGKPMVFRSPNHTADYFSREGRDRLTGHYEKILP